MEKPVSRTVKLVDMEIILVKTNSVSLIGKESVNIVQVCINLIIHVFERSTNTKQAIGARERALCQLTVCSEFQSRRVRSFQDTTDLVNSENLKTAIVQLCNEL